jgi:GDP-L-fucose synthase
LELARRRVVVTGGRGFLGRHVTAALREAGAEVTPLGRRECDLRELRDFVRLLEQICPDAVVHLAAVVGGIGANRAEPGRFLYENAIMGLHLLEACRIVGTQKIVIAGTVCAYPKLATVPFVENDLWNGYPEETNAPYGIAKRLLLVQAQAYRAQYGTNAVCLLPVNLYGTGDSLDLASGHVIPSMIRKFVEARESGGDTVELWGDGSPTREFLHVRDAARAFRLALERYDAPEPVNVGSGAEISIADLATLVARATRFGGTVCWDASQPNGQPRRRLDTSRARAFGFEAEITLAEGVAETVAWVEHELCGTISR